MVFQSAPLTVIISPGLKMTLSDLGASGICVTDSRPVKLNSSPIGAGTVGATAQPANETTAKSGVAADAQ